MKIHSQRAKEIDAYLESHREAQVGKWPIEIGGEKRVLDFYRFPVDLLCYNANNGRLGIERRQWEQDNGRLLDGRLREDSVIIREMLLNLEPDKTEVLENDLHQKGQIEPGVITHDGIVINGNRRMAVLEVLHEKEPTGKWQYLEAVRLPREISERDLWKIEAGLQLSKDKVLQYHPVDALLKIKEGIDRGLSAKEVAAAMYAWKADEVREAIERLQLIDSFLQFWGQPGNYGLIKKFGLAEYFIDVQNRVLAPARRRGMGKRQQARRLQHSFTLIRAGILMQIKGKRKRKGFTHWDIRNLDRVFSDPHAEAAFVQPLEDAENVYSVPEEEVIEGFRDAVEILEMREERDQPLRLIEKAINALESIDTESEYFCSERVKQAVERLLQVAQSIWEEVAEQQLESSSPQDT